jgi:hypothetical protein
MDPAFAFFLMLNNYLHDLSTVMPLVSGIIMRIILDRFEAHNIAEVRSFMLRLYDGITRIVIGSLVLITIGAIPRILTFTSFELADASEKNRIPGLMAKHILALAMVTTGVFIWINLSRRIKRIRESA